MPLEAEEAAPAPPMPLQPALEQVFGMAGDIKTASAADIERLMGLDYDPGEPRLPKGEGGGEWTASAGQAAGHRERNRAFLIPTLSFEGKTYRGKGGELTHADVFKAQPDDVKAAMMKGGAEQVFTTPEGNVLNRREARKYAEKNDLVNKWARSAYRQPDLIAEALKYEARDPSGHGKEFYTPSTKVGMSFEQATAKLGSEAQKTMSAAAGEIDEGLGIKAKATEAIGAWETGAENSLVTQTTGDASMDQLKVSAAMKGALGNQIATLVFRENRLELDAGGLSLSPPVIRLLVGRSTSEAPAL
jgi:hypothetical protein